MRRKKAIVQLASIVVVAILALGWTFQSGNKPLLGLDLQGGVSVVLTPKGQVDDDRIKQAISIMNQRINSLGVSEPDIHQEGNSIVVQIAGVKDRDAAIRLVNQTAELRFRPVMSTLPPDVPGQTSGTTPGSTPGTTPGSTPGTTPGAVPGSADPNATATTTTPGAVTPAVSSPTTAPPVQQNGAGLAPGESAAGAVGWQAPPSTVSDQSPTTVAVPTPSTPTASTPTASTPTASTPTASSPAAQTPSSQLTPEEQQQLQAQAQAQAGAGGATTTPEQDAAEGAEKQTVILPQINPKTGEQQVRYQLGPSALSGSALSGASAGLNPTNGQWIVRPTFKPGAEGIDQFNAIAAKCNAKGPECPSGQLAITLDGRVISAPSINAKSFSADQIEISGSFDEDSAKSLATALKYGALPVALEQQSTQEVSATLGQDSLTAGLVAGFVGFVLVAIYMIAFYRLLGVLAILKLFVEGALLWSVISWLGSSAGLALTLAGVTGIIVSIGVSLDSNVVYYEHLREDVRNGRTVRSAVDKSFGSAIGTIWKADGASLLGAALLYWLAVGPVRGFAFFLALSTALDIVSSYLYMRPVVFLATGSKLCRKRPSVFGLPPEAVVTAAVERTRPSKAKKGSSTRPSSRSSKPSTDDADAEDSSKRRSKTKVKATSAGGRDQRTEDPPDGLGDGEVDEGDDDIIDAVIEGDAERDDPSGDDATGTNGTNGAKR